MRVLVHLSDLHFGRVEAALIEPLIAVIREIAPHLVVVSGDLTQRARSAQFAAARRFLDLLPSPQIVVPGNHDVPLYNVLARFARPLDRYRRYITNDLEPWYADAEIAVLGINTARSTVIKNGRINKGQIAGVERRFCQLDAAITKIIVTHHPFDLPEGGDAGGLVGRARIAMATFARCGADVLLAGHFHTSHAGSTAARYRILGHSALVVQAGTATSSRVRGEANSFNVLRIEHPRVAIERMEWRPETGSFAVRDIERFETRAGHWARSSDGNQPA